jgi:drug/metabolite transporter (DMT)-like permease
MLGRVNEPAPPTRSAARLLALTALAMLAFAGNSLLCRYALRHTGMGPAAFTGVRVISGALTLWLIARLRLRGHGMGGSWRSAGALFAYAAAFSFAYVGMAAGPGALLLFGAVQVTMIGGGLWAGERLRPGQWAGLLLALAGLVALLLPGLEAPPLIDAALMIFAGAAWGVYSLRGRGVADPLGSTAGNFLRAAPMAAVLWLLVPSGTAHDVPGWLSAIASGALTSGVGYALWYAALPGLSATRAAAVQLSVPVIAAFGGVLLLGEAATPRLLIASAAILGGVAAVLHGKPGAR